MVSTHSTDSYDHIIDPQGDFILHCGQRFRVSSKALSLASPFFARLLAEPTKPVTINGSHEAIAILLNIFHFKTDFVPGQDVPIDLLNELAMVAKEWECVRALGPWPRVWMIGFTLNQWEAVKPNDWEKWALIGKVFNQEDILRVVLNDVLEMFWDKMSDAEVMIFERLAGTQYKMMTEELHSRRCGGVDNFKANLQDLIHKIYTKSPEILCAETNPGCGALITISLLQKFYAAGLLSRNLDHIEIPLSAIPEFISANHVRILDDHPRCLEFIEHKLRRLLNVYSYAGTPSEPVQEMPSMNSKINGSNTEESPPISPKSIPVNTKPNHSKLSEISTNIADKSSSPSMEREALKINTKIHSTENRIPIVPALNSSSLTIAETTRRRDLARKLYPNLDPTSMREVIINWSPANEADAQAILCGTKPKSQVPTNPPPSPVTSKVTPSSPRISSAAAMSDSIHGPVDWSPMERKELMVALAEDPNTKTAIKALRKRFGNKVAADRVVYALYKCAWDLESAAAYCEQMLEEHGRAYEG